MLACVEQVNRAREKRIEYQKTDFDLIFLQKDEFINILDDRRKREFDQETFEKLSHFIKNRPFTDYEEGPLTQKLYTYFLELYRLLNIKNTLASTFYRINEIKMQIDSNEFSINYAKQSINVKKKEIEQYELQYEEDKILGQRFSKQIEMAEISHMRTDHIMDYIESYINKL